MESTEHKRPIIVVLGAAGSGKGTQTTLLEEQLGYQRVEAGAVVRTKAQEDSDLGRQLKEINESGRHAPEQMVSDLIIHHISKLATDKPLLFDGYPRSLGQADHFEKIVAHLGQTIDNVRIIWLNIGLDVATRRLLNRAQCSKCKALYAKRDIKVCPRCGAPTVARKDDTPESIAKRLAYFTKETAPVIERYRQKGLVIEVNGEQPVVHVFEEILRALGKRQEAIHYDSD